MYSYSFDNFCSFFLISQSISNSKMDAVEILDQGKDYTIVVENSGSLSLISASAEGNILLFSFHALNTKFL